MPVRKEESNFIQSLYQPKDNVLKNVSVFCTYSNVSWGSFSSGKLPFDLTSRKNSLIQSGYSPHVGCWISGLS